MAARKDARMSTSEGGLWGKIVVAAAFGIQVTGFGTTQAIGVYTVVWLRYFNAGAAAVALVGSINLGVFLGAGPLCSVLMSRWSHRQVALAGAVLSNIGLICMPFAPSLSSMYIFYGIITGLGNSLSYVPSHVLSGLYYSRHRSLATGIATAGSGFGSTLFPIILYYLIEYYGWRGSFFIVTGLNLHQIVFAALLRPVPTHIRNNVARADKLAASKADKKAALKAQKNRSNHRESPNGVTETLLATPDNLEMTEIVHKDDIAKYDIVNHKNTDLTKTSGYDKSNENDIVDREKPCGESSGMISCKDTLTNEYNETEKIKPKAIVRLKNHLLTVFTADFVLFFISNICWNAGGAIVLIFFPEYVTVVLSSKEQASFIFTFMGAGCTIGCVMGGVLGNIKHINRIALYILGNIGVGLVTVLVPWRALHTFGGFLTLILIFGFMFGVILGLLVVVTSDLLGTKALGHGFGYLMLSNGIGVFGGPPIAGLFMDMFGDTDIAMYMSGALTMLGGLIMCFVPLRRRLCPGHIPDHFLNTTVEVAPSTPKDTPTDLQV